MFPLTNTERQIVEHLEAQPERRARSLFQLCVELGLDYHNAWRRVSILEILGILITEREKGKPMIIQLTTPIDGGAETLPPSIGSPVDLALEL